MAGTLPDVTILLRAVKAGGGMLGLIDQALKRDGVHLSDDALTEWYTEALEAGLLRRMGSDGAARPVLQLTAAGQSRLLDPPLVPLAPIGPRLRLSPLAARTPFRVIDTALCPA